MTQAQTLERQVKKLPKGELAKFRDWFLEFEWDSWDRQIARDVKAGKLHGLTRKALADHAKGRTQPL